MKQDLDQLIIKQGADALWITGAAQHNPAMVYLTGGAHVTGADLFIRPGQKPVLCHGMMERDEAAKTGYELLSYAKFPMQAYLEQAHGDLLEASALRYAEILKEIGLTEGKVLLYGMVEFGQQFALMQRLGELMPSLRLSGDFDGSIMLEARATKSTDELARIRHMGQVTTNVVKRTQEFLTAHDVQDEILIKEDGSPLTIGDVKGQINLWLAEAGAENPEDTIFAIGRDAGVPHSSGTPSDPIRLGKSIVFDIFPCEAGGGYFYDFTRTWCLDYAPEEVQKAYDQVKSVYAQIVTELENNVNPSRYQARTCELFEGMGHGTIRQNPQITQGYIHSLGHGVGLNVHEKPWFGREKDPTNILQVGSVFTIEPGLYYPDRGYGIRIEDTWFVREDGSFEKFVEFPMELVLPMKGS